MNVLSGILLTGLVLFIVGFLLREIFGASVARFFASRSREPTKPVTELLIGAVGKVVDNT